MKLPVQQEILKRRIEANKEKIPGPQAGPQEQFLSSKADIAIYGGAAGGGKTWALLLEPLSHIDNPGFGGVIFRRTTVQVRNEGGMWDESAKMYPLVGGVPKEAGLWWKFPTGASVSFAHIEYEKNIQDWQGAQIPFIGFDELTHFTEKQFWYLLSRNRSMCGVKPYIRATCNPDADSWVAKLIAWWINPETGFAIPERSGVIRWFVRVSDQLIWADIPQELESKFPGTRAKSLTFVPALLSDNAALTRTDPSYLANLLALPRVERERLLHGNWKVRDEGNGFFAREWFHRFSKVDKPKNLNIYMTTDHAPGGGEDNDFNCARIWGIDPHEHIWMLDGYKIQSTIDKFMGIKLNETTGDQTLADMGVLPLIKKWKPLCWFPEDDNNWKSAKPFVVAAMRRLKTPCRIEAISASGGDKPTKAQPFQAKASLGQVHLPVGYMGDEALDQYASFPAAINDDDVDCAANIGRALDMAHPAIVRIKINNPNPADLGMFKKAKTSGSWKTR